MAVLEWARTSEFALAHVEGEAYARDELKKRCPRRRGPTACRGRGGFQTGRR